jgi:hypothetical protein
MSSSEMVDDLRAIAVCFCLECFRSLCGPESGTTSGCARETDGTFAEGPTGVGLCLGEE